MLSDSDEKYGKYTVYSRPCILNANANRYWTKAMQPVYPDHDLTTDEDEGSQIELGFVVEANFLC